MNKALGKGQTALITGASGGLGKAFAEIFAEHGFDLVLVARSKDKLESVAKELEAKSHVKVTCIDEDISDLESCKRVYERTTALGIKVDQLVNNAGAGKMGRVVDADVDTMVNLINLDCVAPTVLCRLYGADMVARNHGRILNVASLGAVMADPYFNVYGPSKAFDYFLTAAMYGELLDSEVTVTTLLSGPIKTNWAKNAGKADSGMARDPRDIAMEGFEAMQKGKLAVTATFLYKVGALLTRLLPLATVSKTIAGWQSGLIDKNGK